MACKPMKNYNPKDGYGVGHRWVQTKHVFFKKIFNYLSFIVFMRFKGFIIYVLHTSLNKFLSVCIKFKIKMKIYFLIFHSGIKKAILFI